jgi:hypothetical protein
MSKTGRVSFVGALLVVGMLGYRAYLNAQATDWPEIHAQDDALWARRSNLALQEVRRLRQLAEVPDTSSELIDNIDTSALAQHGRVVFASYGGSAKCVNFWVFSRSDKDFKEIWSSGQAGDQANFCADPRCSVPIVRLRGNLDIEVEIPSYRGGQCAVRSVGLFTWSGSEYTYKGVVGKGAAGKAK